MVVRIVIAGESQSEGFAQICLVADYLSQNLPSFCYERIEKSVLEWQLWLLKINEKNGWHHVGSPLIWKELLMKGSKPYYIGGASQFLDYCYSYYHFQIYLDCEKFEGLVENFKQYHQKVKNENNILTQRAAESEIIEIPHKKKYVICISGAGNPLTMHLISSLLEMSVGEKSISKIFIYDSQCSLAFMDFIENECKYIGTNYPGRVVKYVPRIGLGLTFSDLLIILDHVPFDEDASIGDWLSANRKIMKNLALMINASAPQNIRIVFPNVGPACYNATVLAKLIHKSNINVVVATSDLGLEIAPYAAEIAEVPMKNMFCSPVWGFVGINHLVDIRTTIHKYNTFEPYIRYTRVRNSSLNIGSLTPEMRTMEYLMHFDETLWIKVAENKKKMSEEQLSINKSVAVVNIVKLWLFGSNPDVIINLGIHCDGSFGLTFKGVFSQPSRIVNDKWIPANNYILPKDPQMKLSYLENIAEMTMDLKREALPKIIPHYPCICTPKLFKKKEVW